MNFKVASRFSYALYLCGSALLIVRGIVCAAVQMLKIERAVSTKEQLNILFSSIGVLFKEESNTSESFVHFEYYRHNK